MMQMVVEYPSGDTKSKSIPIEDIGVVILDSPQITITHVLLNKLRQIMLQYYHQ
jgi:CRISPR-associated protein Cas1